LALRHPLSHLGEVTLDNLFFADGSRLAAQLSGQRTAAMRCLTANRDDGDEARQLGLPDDVLRACRSSFGTEHWLSRVDG